MAKIFRALANPNRLKIGSPTVSHHVRELVNADLITAEREGKFLVCRINPRTKELARAVFDV